MEFEFEQPEWVDLSNAEPPHGHEDGIGFLSDAHAGDHQNHLHHHYDDHYDDGSALIGVGGDVGLCLLGGNLEEESEILLESGVAYASPVPQAWSPGLTPADGGDARAPSSGPAHPHHHSHSQNHSGLSATPESTTSCGVAKSRAKATTGGAKRKTSQEEKGNQKSGRASSEEADELDANGVKLIMGRKPRERYDFGEVDKRERNRLAAAALREKRKEYVTELESEVLTLREMVRSLKADNARLVEANGELKSHNAFLQGLMGSEQGPASRAHQQHIAGDSKSDTKGGSLLSPLAESESSRKRQRTVATVLCSVLASVAVVSGGTLLGPNGAAYEDGVPVSSTRFLLGTSHDVVVSPAQTSAFFSLTLCLGALLGVFLTTLWGGSTEEQRKK